MQTTPHDKSLWDAYILMVEKSPTYTVLFTGIVLLLICLILLLLILACFPGLRGFVREIVKGLKYSEGKLAYEGSPKSEETIQTDDKGNVKPPISSSDPEDRPQLPGSDRDQFYWLFRIQYAWKEPDISLTKLSEYYDNIQKAAGALDASFINAEYLLARFQCGDGSALNALKAKAGASPDAHAANGTLATYYESIGANDEALKFLELRFRHAPNSHHKLYSTRNLAIFLDKVGRSAEALTLLYTQLTYFQSANDQATLWETMGTIHERNESHWLKQLCFEESLRLNPDNTTLRFSLAYSYGERDYGSGMAAHHYRILLKQRPSHSMAINNLAVIYDQIGAISEKTSLLREAARRKDNSYVAANLAAAYAKAGFIDDARDYLENVPTEEQQEGIVRAAYRSIRNQVDADKSLITKIERLIKLEVGIVSENGLPQLHRSREELLYSFLGEWRTDNGTVLSVRKDNDELTCELEIRNEHYEQAVYDVTARYEPGILQLEGALDEKSLKVRQDRENAQSTRTSGGIGSFGVGLFSNSLLGSALNRPSESVLLFLIPQAEGALIGLHAASSRGNAKEIAQTLLSAQTIHFTKASLDDH